MLVSVLCTLALTQTAKPATPITITRQKTLPHFRVLSVAPAPTGATFAASLEDRTVRIVDAKTSSGLRTFSGHPDSVYGVAISPDGKILASGDETARIWLWDIPSGKKTREFTRQDVHIRGIQALNFSPDGKLLASTGKDDVIIVWRVADGRPIKKILGNGANFYSATFAPGGTVLLAPSLNGGLRFYRTNDWTVIKTLDNHAGQGAMDVAINPAGTLAVTAGRNAAAVLVNLQKRERVNTFRGHDDWVVRTAISPNGRIVATSSSDRTVRIWNSSTFQTIAKLESQSAVGAPLAFTRDGRYFIAASESDALEIYAVNPPQAAAPPAKPAPKRKR